MIAHVSIPSKSPRDTSLFFATLIGGVAFEFPVVPGAWIADEAVRYREFMNPEACAAMFGSPVC
jgi:hypothetical protein